MVAIITGLLLALGVFSPPQEEENVGQEQHAASATPDGAGSQAEAIVYKPSAASTTVMRPLQSTPASLIDGEYTLQLTHTARHPKVQFPTDLVPEAEYKKVDEPPSLVRFSDDLKTLRLVGYGGVGELESRAGDTLVYTLDRGLDASGGPPAQVIVTQTKDGITATLIQFGSGVPVIVSHKGTLVEKTTKDGHPANKADDDLGHGYRRKGDFIFFAGERIDQAGTTLDLQKQGLKIPTDLPSDPTGAQAVTLPGTATKETDANAASPPSEPLTWKSLLGKEPPEGYPTDALKLIEALNNSRGEWIFAGKIKREDAEAESEAAMEIRGGFKNMIRQDSFPQWQIVVAWPCEEPTNGLVLNVMALPEPDGIKWMLAPQYSSRDGGPVPGRHKMFQGSWNAETATVTWTSTPVRSPLKKDDPAEKPDEAKAAFEMVVKRNGEIQFTSYQHNESLGFSGKAAARVGEPFVEKEPAIRKLPGGYKIFFASRLEVCLDSDTGPIVAGPRIEKIGCEGSLIFGLIAMYVEPERSDKPGYFWLDTTTGEITKGLELAAWREALKTKGIREPRLFAPESVGE